MSNKPLGTLDMTSNKFITPVYGNSGDHRMHGIFIAHGPQMRQGFQVQGARIIDYAPTILHTFGAEVPVEMDGRVLEEIFTADYLATNPVRLTATSNYVESSGAVTMTDEESEEIRERLKSLGYLG